MTPDQALQLMHLHHKQVNLASSFIGGPLRPGESSDLRSARLARLYRAKLAEMTENEIAAKVIGDAARRPGPGEIVLPDLAQVKGWSEAQGREGLYGPAAMFGGWRIGDLSPEQRSRLASGAAGRGAGPVPPASVTSGSEDAACAPAPDPACAPRQAAKRAPTPEEVERWLWGDVEEDGST